MVAIYVRQSLEKVDSISLDTQADYAIAICEKNKWKYKIYRDSGFSGKDTDRPAFQQLLQDIKNKTIEKVIAYRFDRISRNIVDFGNLLQMFQKYNVGFISATENFDTSTPTGTAMMMIVMVFAQLERETIAIRITDNYFARAKRGTFVGGGIPYGYKIEKTKIDNKNVSILVSSDSMVEHIYNEFVVKNKSIRSLAAETKTTSTFIRRILSNSFYAKADINIYNWLKSKGYIIYNDIDNFTGEFGVQIFGKEKGRKNRKTNEIAEQIAVIGRHTPLIDSNMFLLAQEKLENSKLRKVAKKEFGKYSWLTGIIKCGDCGHSVGVKVCKSYKYALCSKHRLYNSCTNKENYKLEDLENIVLEKVRHQVLNTPIKFERSEVNNDLVNKKNKLQIEITKIDEQINNLVNAIASGTSLSNILENKIKELSQNKSNIEKEIADLNLKMSIDSNVVDTTEYTKHIDTLNKFDGFDITTKRDIIKFFVREITLTPDKLDIFYRF